MRSLIVLKAAAGLVAASPASAAPPASSSGSAPVNLNSVANTPNLPTQGPPVLAPVSGGGIVSTTIYNSVAASASAVAAASTIASAILTTSEAAAGNNNRRRNGNYYGKPTTTTKGTTTANTAATSSPVITVPSSCTPVSWTNTNAFITNDPACTQSYEVGTYCGFINPEDPCAPQPAGYGPVATPDTADAFTSNQALHDMAQKAVTPTGWAQTFKDLSASVNANSYMGYMTLKSYDVQACANFCNSTTLCTGFNIFIERDPAWNGQQCSCSTPGSTTNYKCSIWGSGVEAAAATNSGQTRSDGFQVVIVGSNGYEKTNDTTPVTPPGWTNPGKCGGQIHQHPGTCMGQKFFPGPYDVSLCASYADAQNVKNKASGVFSKWFSWLGALFGYNPGKCTFFNAFMIKENGVAKGTYCNLYAQQYKTSAANYMPGWAGNTFWGVESSWTYCSS